MSGKNARTWTDDELAVLERVFPTEPRSAVLEALPGRTWNGAQRVAVRHGLTRMRVAAKPKPKPTRRGGGQMAPGKLAACERYLADWLALDLMEPRSPREGWRDADAVREGTGLKMERTVATLELLADLGRIEVRSGDSGWIFYRARTGKA